MAARKKPTGSTKEERDRISLGRIESFIDTLAANHLQCPTCKSKMDVNDLKDIPASVSQLIKVRYDKLRPSLQATELTVHDPRDMADPAELSTRLAALFAEKPQLWDQVVALRASQQAHENSTEHQVTH